MIKQVRQAGIYDLLHVPIILLFSCLVFQEHNSLPKTQTEIYQEIFKLLIDRSAEKDESLNNLDKDSLDKLLDILGEASRKALQKDTGQLLVNKVNHLPFSLLVHMDFMLTDFNTIIIEI